jgi:hypothetical protein
MPIDVEQVAKAFVIPVSGIRRTLKTEEVAAKYGDSVHSASLFEFESEPNVTMQVIVTQGHFLLTDVLRGRLEGEPAVMERIDLENAGVAFIGIEGAGPGAEGYVAIAHLPSRNLDFRLRVMLSNDGVTSSDTSSVSTLRNGQLLKQALRTLAISSSTKLAQMVNPLPSPTTKGTPPVAPPRSPGSDGQVDHKSTTERGLQITQAEPKSKTLKSFAVAIFIFGLVVTYWLWRKRKMNQSKGGQ